MIFTALIVLACVVPTSYSSPIDSCVVNNVAFQHGKTISLPGLTACIKHRCEHGVANLVEEGCEYYGECHGVGQTWVVDCRRYKCSKTQQDDDTFKYSVSLDHSQCKDAKGDCRNPGDTFRYTANGVTYSQCTCNVEASGKIKYSCSG